MDAVHFMDFPRSGENALDELDFHKVRGGGEKKKRRDKVGGLRGFCRARRPLDEGLVKKKEGGHGRARSTRIQRKILRAPYFSRDG